MRTLTTLLTWALSLSEKMDETERKYDVSGLITLTLRTEPNIPAVQREIIWIMKKFPWRGERFPYQTQEEANEYMISEGTTAWRNEHDPEKILSFYITPINNYLRRSQVYAYEQHLATVAEKLSKRATGLAYKVYSVIEVRARTSFST